ncbi:hypothetical protein VTO42DRAFT_737 [Malbranchea cinnamomea]
MLLSAESPHHGNVKRSVAPHAPIRFSWRATRSFWGHRSAHAIRRPKRTNQAQGSEIRVRHETSLTTRDDYGYSNDCYECTSVQSRPTFPGCWLAEVRGELRDGNRSRAGSDPSLDEPTSHEDIYSSVGLRRYHGVYRAGFRFRPTRARNGAKPIPLAPVVPANIPGVESTYDRLRWISRYLLSAILLMRAGNAGGIPASLSGLQRQYVVASLDLLESWPKLAASQYDIAAFKDGAKFLKAVAPSIAHKLYEKLLTTDLTAQAFRTADDAPCKDSPLNSSMLASPSGSCKTTYLLESILTHPAVPRSLQLPLLRALNKILWTQNDFFARGRVRETQEFSGPHGAIRGPE